MPNQAQDPRHAKRARCRRRARRSHDGGRVGGRGRASSRKKTDKRDAYLLVKGLASGMMPHSVYQPSGQLQRLRQPFAQRAALRSDLTRWLLRAKTSIVAAGCPVPRTRKLAAMREALLERPEGLDQHVSEVLERCQHMQETLAGEHAWEDGDFWRAPLNDKTARVGATHARHDDEEVIHAETLITISGRLAKLT